jgi:aromatic-L-amino-acid decarboxylase
MNQYQINIPELQQAIEKDLAAGLMPFCVVGNAGTVNTGAIDDLDAIAAICQKFKLWFHVDGAFGALAKLTDEYASALKAIELADSVAFDFHKWMYVNYEVGCLLVKDREKHRAAFALAPNYLTVHERGLAAGPESFNNYGLELSRGFKALKVWMSLKEHGMDKYRRLIRQNIAQCFYLGSLIEKEANLELMTPVSMNIVCYRFNPGGLSEEALHSINKELLMQLQEKGIAAPSSTILQGKYVIRVANVNHRSRKEDFEVLVKASVQLGTEISTQMSSFTKVFTDI